MIWCGNVVTEWGLKAEAYFLGRNAEEAHAFMVREAHLAAARIRDAERRLALHGWRMIHGEVQASDLEEVDLEATHARKDRG